MAYRTFTNGEILTASHLNDYLMNQSVIVCTSGTRPSAPTEGMVIYESDTKAYLVYNGTTFVRSGMFDHNTYGMKYDTEATVQSFTSSTYSPGSPVCGTTFIAPPSGIVFVTVTGYLEQTNNTNETRLGWEIRSGGTIGSGSVVWAATYTRSLTTTRSVTSGGEAVIGGSHRSVAGSLTPGATYNARTMHMVSGGNGDIDYRQIIIEPVH